MIVVDTNVVVYAVLEGEQGPVTDRAHDRDATWVVPPWWRAECVNALVVAVRRGFVTPAGAAAAWLTALELVTEWEVPVPDDVVLETALRDGLSGYDAQFVALADALGVPLVTADRRIVAARPDRAVLLEEFAR